MFKQKNKKNSQQSGFTLIELMVVISIISFLSSILLVAVVNARIKGRDSKRVSDLSAVQQALEFYYADHGNYPSTACNDFTFPDWSSPDNSSDGGVHLTTPICDTPLGPTTSTNINETLRPYIKPITDPSPSTNLSLAGHWYVSDGKSYIYQIIGYPEKITNYPQQFIDTALCSLPLAPDGTCGSSGSDPYLSEYGYSWINSITIHVYAPDFLAGSSYIHGFILFHSGG